MLGKDVASSFDSVIARARAGGSKAAKVCDDLLSELIDDDEQA